MDQRKAHSGRDIIGRDQTNNYINLPPKSKVEKLLTKLKYEMDNEEKFRDTIEQLARYQFRKSKDGIDGLEKKLKAANRSEHYERAIEQKEMFAKLLDSYGMHHSGQILFAHFLAEVEDKFNTVIYPAISDDNETEIAQKVSELIVKPIINECGADFITLDHNIVSGMIYWLAELCFLRWHK